LWWITGEQWSAASMTERLQPGDTVTIGFDGSRSGDATALVACRMDDALLQPLKVFQSPEGSDAQWRVHSGEVDRAVDDAYNTYNVVRGYYDPPLWQSEIEGWVRQYGQPAVTPYSTNTSRMIHAVERFRTDLVSGAVHHTSDRTLNEHIMNARTREVRGGYWLMKDRESAKIDAAVASVLAYEARCDAIAAGVQRKTGFAFL
jgi:phage terminase large subunit-like protein